MSTTTKEIGSEVKQAEHLYGNVENPGGAEIQRSSNIYESEENIEGLPDKNTLKLYESFESPMDIYENIYGLLDKLETNEEAK